MLHPRIIMPDQFPPPPKIPEPQNPVRDDSRLGATEDLDRAPDGFPHVTMAVLVVAIVAIAGVALMTLRNGEGTTTALLILAILPLTYGILRSARSRRNQGRHASR